MRALAAQAAWIAAHQTAPFNYGTWDCVLFAFGAVKALTGVDHLALDGVAVWKDEKAARRELAKRGGLIPAISAVLPLIPTARAMRGDLGTIDNGQGPTLVVVEGLALVGTGLDGLMRLPRRYLVAAWNAEGFSQ